MFVWNPNRTLDSAIVKGVRYHFRRFSAGRRSDLEVQLAEFRAKSRDLAIEFNESLESVSDDTDKTNPAVRRNMARWAVYNAEMQSLRDRYELAAKLRAYLTRVEGLSLDGEHEITVEQFIAEGPEDLASEVSGYIDENGGLSADELKNSLSPCTSSDPAQQGPTPTTAGNAETTEPMSDAGVLVGSPTA